MRRILCSASARRGARVDAVDAWADGESLRRLLPGAGATTPSKPGNGGRRAKRPTARQLATLRFKRTAEVTQTSHQAVMDLLEPGCDRAALVAELDRVKSVAHAGSRRPGRSFARGSTRRSGSTSTRSRSPATAS